MDRHTRAAFKFCKQLTLRSGSNFSYAFWTLPREMRRDMYALYAFMRRTDDIGDDLTVRPGFRKEQLERWKESSRTALAGSPESDPILLALADVHRRREIPAQYLLDVISGVETDIFPNCFQTWKDLESYCYQVAGAVGLCCIHLWGFNGPEPRQPAIACGNAFQLTNILRDLSEDVSNGRTYLPIEDLEQFGLTSTTITDPAKRDDVRQLVRFEVERAEEYYRIANEILPILSRPGQRIQSAFMDLYGSLLQQIRNADFDVLARRIELSRLKKSSIALRCVLGLQQATPTVVTAPTSGHPQQPTHSGN